MSNYVSRPTGGSLITMDIAAADHVNRLEILRKLEDLYSQLLTDPNQVVNVIFQVNRMLTQSKMFCWEFAFDLAKLLILLIKYTTLSPNQNSIIVFEFFKDVIQHKMECKFASPAAFNTIIDHIKSILPLIAHGKGPSNFPFEYYKRFLTICDPMLKQLYAYRQIGLMDVSTAAQTPNVSVQFNQVLQYNSYQPQATVSGNGTPTQTPTLTNPVQYMNSDPNTNNTGYAIPTHVNPINGVAHGNQHTAQPTQSIFSFQNQVLSNQNNQPNQQNNHINLTQSNSQYGSSIYQNVPQTNPNQTAVSSNPAPSPSASIPMQQANASPSNQSGRAIFPHLISKLVEFLPIPIESKSTVEFQMGRAESEYFKTNFNTHIRIRCSQTFDTSQKHIWPDHLLQIRINSKNVNFAKKSKEILRDGRVRYHGVNIPLDTNLYIKEGTNIVYLVFGAISDAERVKFNMVLHIDLVSLFSIENFQSHIKSRRIPIQDFKNEANKLLNPDDDDCMIVQDFIPLSLKCPLTCRRILIPIRSNTCRHLNGFDLMTWTTLLSTRKDFIQLECPVCGKSIHSQSLFVDDYIEDVLKRTSEDTEIVHITKDLNWINPNEEPMESNAAKKIKFDPQETVKSANSTSSNTQVVVLDESETDELESSNENTVIVDTNQPIGIAIEQTGSIMAQPAETNALPVQTKSTHSTPLQNPTAPTVQPIPRQSEEIPKNNQNEHGQETENEQPDTAKDASSLSHPSTTTPLPSQSIHNKHKDTDRTESSKSLSASHVSQSSNNTNAANAPNPNHSQCISTTSGANVDTNKNNLPNANSNANSNKSSTSNDINVNETRNTNVSNAKTTACESIGKNTTESVSTESYPSLFDLNDSEKKQMGNIIEPEFEDDAFSDDTVSVADSDSESFT